MSSPVYFINLKATRYSESLIHKIEDLYKESKFSEKVNENDNVIIKTRFGELNNTSFINPLFIHKLVKLVKKENTLPTVMDTAPIYSPEEETLDQKASIHGFIEEVLDAEVKISNNNEKIDRDIERCDALIVVTHFTANPLTGFSGALEHTGYGCATKYGKTQLSKIAQPMILKNKCVMCGDCYRICPVKAVEFTSRGAINKDLCLGCNVCVPICPTKTIQYNFLNTDEYAQSYIEYAQNIINNKKDNKVLFINFLIDITPNNDNINFNDRCFVNDIGILASYDPVAIDKASYDLINDETGIENSQLKRNHESGEDKFSGIWPRTDSLKQIELAEEKGLGTQDYELITVRRNKL